MLDDRVIKVLEFLQPFGFTTTVNIAPLIDELFEYNANDTEFDFNTRQSNVGRFLRGLDQASLIAINSEHYTYNITLFRNREDGSSWYRRGLEASITEIGLGVLSDYKKDKLVEISHESALKVNESIIATNESVQLTNQRSIETTERQNQINQTIAANSGIQADASRRQTRIFRWTATFAFGSMIITGISLWRDFHKDKLSQQLSQKDSLIQSLQASLKALKSDTSHLTAAKKTLTKKN